MEEVINRELIDKEIVYDGEDFTRESIQNLVKEYQDKNQSDICKLEELKKLHDEIAGDMNKDLVEARSAWDYIKAMVAGDPKSFSSNFQGLLEKIPIISQFVPNRPIQELLQDKLKVAEKRTKEMAKFLDRVESEVQSLRDDITRLNKKMIIAATNEEKAAKHILEITELKKKLEEEIETIADKKSVEYREKEATLDEIKKKIWEHGAKLRIFSSAEDRIANIVKMNNNFLEILTNLHANMTILYEAGNEVLDDLRGNLSGLSAVTEASDISLKMQESLENLKESVNKVASLASSTSLYITQNVERMTSEMKIYDEETKKLIEDNLAREREIQQKRVDETIALAVKEYGLLEEARRGKAGAENR